MSQRICTRCGGQLGDSDSQVTLCDPSLLHVVINSQDSHSATDGLAHDTGPRIAPQNPPYIHQMHLQTPPYHNLSSKPDNTDGSWIFRVGCAYGNDTRVSIFKCLWCRSLQHRKCVGGDVYVCDTGSQIPKDISTMYDPPPLQQLTGMVHTLVDSNVTFQNTS